MTFTVDYATDRGKVRLLIPDRVELYEVFSDAEIDAFLEIEASSVRRATALALETMASNEAYVQKVIRTQDLQTNGAQTAASLMARAALLRKQADDDDAHEVDGNFDIAELVLDDFSARDRIYKESQRMMGL